MLEDIGYQAFLVFVVFCAVSFLWALYVLPELKGVSLEEMDAFLGDKASAVDRERRKMDEL